ncbi:RluA family pseudouridine synthase [Leucothrix arctica]|uniref:Dual-specificity RNA pseudouridine synthase RluA n=1 Tax=Leucothrix arctica TaxID=1481894 RepID=A0A317CA95_9GAMM|nr:pseudouridine synthase [Leucothrix arctica]PWQ92992.1 RNA pseudouridine synthase [Leucothrix arctica]
MNINPYRPPVHEGLNILQMDDDLILIDKPSGLLSVPGRGEDKQDCLISRVQQEYPEALIVHRLDMDTSGVMVLARNKSMHRELSLLFQERKTEKHYSAVVEGIVHQTSGRIDLPLLVDWPNRPKQQVNMLMGKPAVTFFNVMSRNTDSDSTLMDLRPITGRTHQLRVHMEFIGHAILGDDLYAPLESLSRSPRLLLHARQLEFKHPISNQTICCSSEIPF